MKHGWHGQRAAAFQGSYPGNGLRLSSRELNILGPLMAKDENTAAALKYFIYSLQNRLQLGPRLLPVPIALIVEQVVNVEGLQVFTILAPLSSPSTLRAKPHFDKVPSQQLLVVGCHLPANPHPRHPLTSFLVKDRFTEDRRHTLV